ncbi:unnamed protein product, partial [Echinostoma caproni]|uniref:Pept_C1 domain-containing protein n=1 Tax=Echinostoma caproni TaxID=27848 RepID=A0A183AJG9_9TREM
TVNLIRVISNNLPHFNHNDCIFCTSLRPIVRCQLEGSSIKTIQECDRVQTTLGALFETPEQRNSRRPTGHHNAINCDLPKSFDAQIRDQSSCGSCWYSMTNRTCIDSNGRLTADLSALDLIGCCCPYCGLGCRGGFPVETGIVTGGSLENPTGCSLYPFPKCDHQGTSKKLKTCPTKRYNTPDCPTEYQAGYNRTYEDEYHAVRMFGWGEDNGEKHGLLANSENGFFRIRLGVNESGIESRSNAGVPRV